MNKNTINLRNIYFLNAAVIVAMFIIAGFVWFQIPAGTEVCTHWNAEGICDDYGSKFTGIMLLPLISTAVLGLLPLTLKIDPRRQNLLQSGRAITSVFTIIALFFLVIHIVIMVNLLNVDANFVWFVPSMVGVLFIVIGNYLGKIRSNFFVGIRTPWTLSSELSWNKTHRLGGKLFVAQGLLMIISTFLFPGIVWVYVLIGSIFALVIGLFVYSYVVWKNDPDVTAV
ncbi:MAG: SdpI family protein [Chloroflexota bacterium]